MPSSLQPCSHRRVLGWSRKGARKLRCAVLKIKDLFDRYFRDHLIAASLKQNPAAAKNPAGINFRDHLIAASLKRAITLTAQPPNQLISAII